MATAQDIKTRLENERERLEKELTVLATEGRSDEDLAYGTYGTHLADEATDTFEHERALALARHMRGLLDQVERALHKLEAGSYGRCDGCGGSIGVARLEALPHATLCLPCQARQEASR